MYVQTLRCWVPIQRYFFPQFKIQVPLVRSQKIHLAWPLQTTLKLDRNTGLGGSWITAHAQVTLLNLSYKLWGPIFFRSLILGLACSTQRGRMLLHPPPAKARLDVLCCSLIRAVFVIEVSKPVLIVLQIWARQCHSWWKWLLQAMRHTPVSTLHPLTLP